MSFVLQWIDLIWLPLGLIVVHKGQRILSAGFFIACMIMMRFQVEIMQSIGYPRGILPLMQSDIWPRALITYSIMYALFLGMAYYSPGSDKHVFMAASISIFFVSLFVSMIVMVL